MHNMKNSLHVLRHTVLITRLCSCCLSSTRQPLLTGMSPWALLFVSTTTFFSFSLYKHNTTWFSIRILFNLVENWFVDIIYNQKVLTYSNQSVQLYYKGRHNSTCLEGHGLTYDMDLKEQEQLTWLKFPNSSSNYTEDNNGHHVLEPLHWTSWFET
jgi:hypothetical protein